MKRVLFISTTFNSYYKEIIKEFVNIDYEVDWYSDRPSNSIFTRALIRLNSKILKRRIKKYANKILNETKNVKYDYVFVILGQSFDNKFWAKLKEEHSEAKFVYYLWDSSANFKCIAENYKYFDEVFSFDKKDCEKYNFKFHPLFYINQFEISEQNLNYHYDYSYIGTVKPGRYSEIKQIINQLDNYGMKGFSFFYLHSKNVLRYYKFKHKNEFRKVKSNELNFNLLSKEDCFAKEYDSRIIVDVPQPGQFGLTIRVFEAMGMNKKIITTNPDIINYDFYLPQNIYVIKNKSIDFNDVFFKEDYIMLDDNIKRKYSITEWLKRILED